MISPPKPPKVSLLTISLRGGGAERQVATLANTGTFHRVYLLEGDIHYFLRHDLVICLCKTASQAGISKLLRLPLSIFKLLSHTKQETHLISFMERANFVNILLKLLRPHKAIVSVRTSTRGIKAINRIVMKILYPFADHIVVNSEGSKNGLIRMLGWPASRVSVIHNALDHGLIQEYLATSPSEQGPKTRNIVWCGRFISSKNPLAMVKVFHHLKGLAGFEDLILVMLGNGPQLVEIQAWVAHHQLTHAVIFPGFRENPYGFFSNASVFVHTSEMEGFPNVVIEAMACGAPVVVTDCDYGPREILDPKKRIQQGHLMQVVPAEFGILVPVISSVESAATKWLSPNEQPLEEGLRILLESADLRAHYQRQSSVRAAQFSVEEINAQWHRLVEALS